VTHRSSNLMQNNALQEGSEMSTRAQGQATDPGDGQPPVVADHDDPRLLAESGADRVPDRRRFVRSLALGGAAVAAGAAAVPLVGAAEAGAQTTTTAALPPTIPAGDVRLVNFDLGLELAASQLYVLMDESRRVTGEPLGYIRTYVTHHAAHATALGTLAADQATSTANATLLSHVTPQINAATTAQQIYQIAFSLEQSMAATHQQLIATAANWQSAATIATLEPVEAQHAVVWGQLLNLPTAQWMPAFQSISGAFDLATYAPAAS
jgi:Ferritin-like domain